MEGDIAQLIFLCYSFPSLLEEEAVHYVLAISALLVAFAAGIFYARGSRMSHHWLFIVAGSLLTFAFWPAQ